jgi:DNA-binding transcriptional regulator YhcF (GntR family)
MTYSPNQSIFIQIADRICDRVLNGAYQPDDRIPSVRELATEMEVNPNTVMRSFERLQNHGIIYNKRGIGYFISPDARSKIHEMRHSYFIDVALPSVFKEMALLDVSFDELTKTYTNYLSTPVQSKQHETK